jgi:hypothetical protein
MKDGGLLKDTEGQRTARYKPASHLCDVGTVGTRHRCTRAGKANGKLGSNIERRYNKLTPTMVVERLAS